jgi:hypothetical protein
VRARNCHSSRWTGELVNSVISQLLKIASDNFKYNAHACCTSESIGLSRMGA